MNAFRLSMLRALEAVLVVAASAAFVALTHDIHYILTAPYWLDEVWVAASTRLPLADLLHVSSSTPPGWNLLQRPFAALGEQGGRILPLLFIVGAGVCAYYAAGALVRERPVGRALVGALTAFGVLVVPMTLERNDLKQYSADGCLALLLLLTAAIARHRRWSPPRLWLFAAVSVAAFAVSIPSVLVYASLAVCWLIDVLLRTGGRTRSRLAELGRGAIPLAAGAAGIGILYLVLYARADNASLGAYWAPYYPPLAHLPGHLVYGLLRAGGLLLLGSVWPTLLGILVAMGALVWRARSPFAAMPAVLLAGASAAGVLRAYPLLDTRTSYYLFVVLTFFACVGAGEAILWLGGLVARLPARLPGRRIAAGALVVVLSVGLVGLAGLTSKPHARQHTIPAENARDQIHYVAAHYRPGDVILLNRYAGYQFAVYWTRDTPGWVTDDSFATGFQIAYPGADHIIVATSDSPSWVTDAARTAAAQHGTLWVVRTHMSPTPAAAWIAAGHLTVIPTGSEPLAYLPASR